MSTEAKIPSYLERSSPIGIGCGNVVGLSFIFMGIVLLLIPFIGIPLIIMGIFVLVQTSSASKKVFKCMCPYCGNSHIVCMSAVSYFNCPKCGEKVIYADGKFYTQKEFQERTIR